MKKVFSLFLVSSLFLSYSCSNIGLVLEDKTKALFDEAKIKNDSGKELDAIEIYTRIIAQDESSVKAYENRAWIYSKKEDYSKAGTDFSLAAVYSKKTDPVKAGDLYYTSALNYELIYGCKSLVKDTYKKACDLGNQKACSTSCK